MRIGYFADGPWSHKALDKIINDSQFEIAFIVVRFDQPDSVLKKYAQDLQVPFLLNSNVNSSEFIETICRYEPDINVSMSFNQILKKSILNIAPMGFINCHAGQLPFYRGRNVLNWALINGESHFGVTVHHINEGIDTGDIILQRLAPIENTDDYSTLLQKAYTLCADTLYDALLLLKNGEYSVVKQSSIHPVGFYCGRRINGDEYIDWNWSSRRIYNFVRAIVPPAPGARSYINDSEIIILKTELIEDAPEYIGVPGEVVGKDDKGIIIKTGDTSIYITRIGDPNHDSDLINERKPNFKIGTRFGVFNIFNELTAVKQRLNKLEKLLGVYLPKG